VTWRIGVLGAADIALRRTVPAMLAHPATEVVAIASRDLAKAEQFASAFGCDAEPGHDAVLDRADVDAVYVPIPVMVHGEWVARALSRGKHVLVEKPLAATAADAAALVERAASAGLVLMENFTALHHRQHAEVRAVLESGTVGDLRGVSATFTIPPKPDGDIRYRPDVGGGALLDMGIYPLRVALSYLGDDVEVVGAVLRHDPVRDVVLSGDVLLATAAGQTAQLTFGMGYSYVAAYTVAGSTGRIRLDRAYTPPDDHRPSLRVERQAGHEVRDLRTDRQFVNAIGDFVSAMGGDATVLASHHADALRSAELIDHIERTARRASVRTCGRVGDPFP
jgi:dTDP-3,4-didehydro-2,6-dideoxy-alpha-D-glucose 3-reductase